MTKAKIMLLSVAIVAVVGGALAFKAQKTFSFNYCTTNDEDNATQIGLCDFIQNVKTTDDPGTQFYYTRVQQASDCDLVSCPTFKTIVGD